MKPVELEWLERHATGRELVIELGSFLGRSSVALAAAKNLVCVDLWKIQEQERAAGAVNEDIYAEFVQNVSGESNVTAIECDLKNSKAVAELIARYRHTADMVFIDASHAETDAANDIVTAQQLLKDGGLLCGHDYSGAWPGVMAAVDRLLPEAKPTGAGSIWSCPFLQKVNV